MVGRGVPQCGRAICFRRRAGAANAPSVEEDDDDDKEDEEEDDDEGFPIIGYVTSGTFSQIRGRGFGVGLCSLSGLQRALTAHLIRSRASDAPSSMDAFRVLVEGRLGVEVVALSPRNDRQSNKKRGKGKGGGGGGAAKSDMAKSQQIQRRRAVLRVRFV